MATVTTPRRRDMAEARRRVRSPLERLRGHIRLYVGAESLALLVTAVALWFWAGLLLDWGAIRLAGLDWVQLVPPVARAFFLGSLFAGVVALVRVGVTRRSLLLVGLLSAVLGLLFAAAAAIVVGVLTRNLLVGLVSAVLVFGTVTVLAAGFVLVVVAVIRLILASGYRAWIGFVALVAYVVGWCFLGILSQLGPLRGWPTGLLTTAALVLPLAVIALMRLLHEFGDRALALVLERRFPRVLGDRLITAVELSDVRLATELGYSPAMVEETIHEAAERVGRLPLQEVFDWRRLARLGALVAAATLGAYVLVGLGFALAAAFLGDPGQGSGFGRLHAASYVWAQRNLLLRNTAWPRRAQLEYLGQFGEADEVRVGRDIPPPAVRVRALKWVCADRDAPEGWRPLHWGDLTPGLLGSPVPQLDLPAEWAQRDPVRGPSLDEVELRLDQPETHRDMDAETQVGLRDVLARLEEYAARPRVAPRVRMLTVPETVVVSYRTRGGNKGELTLQKQKDNEYAGPLADLKESYDFVARAEDFATPPKTVTVVPPPTLTSLVRDEYQPAYLYYRPRDDVRELARLKQHHQDLASLYGGETSKIDVPAGSDVVLTATTDKELQEGGAAIAPPKKGQAAVKAPVTLLSDEEGKRRRFQVRFDNVRAPLDFTFEFVDTDNVVGRRQVLIRPVEDQPPELEVQVEVIRKTPQGYLVTPQAEVPFSGKIRDDRGLASVEYVYQLTRLDSPSQQLARAVPLLPLMPQLAGGGAANLLTAAGLVAVYKPQGAQETTKAAVPLRAFSDYLRTRHGEHVPWSEVLANLDQEPPARALLKDFALDPDNPEHCFDLDPSLSAQRYPGRARMPQGLKAPEGKSQPRYRMLLWVEAADTDILTGPHRGQSKERFTFLVVSEEELLSEIAKEEETLHVKLDGAVQRLREGENKVTQMKLDLAASGFKVDQLGPMALRLEELEQRLDKSLGACTEVYTAYARILKELRANRVQTTNLIDNVEKNIVNKLKEILDADFPEAQKAASAARGILDGQEADPAKKLADSRAAVDQAGKQLTQLIKRLDEVLEHMEKLKGVNDLVKILLAIREGQGEQEAEYEKIKRRLEDILLESLDKPDGKEKKPLK